jgi:hypothetical protein
MMKIKMILMAFALFSVNANAQSKRLFSTGFENGVKVVPDEKEVGQLGLFKGKDTTKPKPNDWGEIKPGSDLVRAYVFYEGGDESMRYARVETDPINSANHVLHFWVNQANAMNGQKARVQTTFHRDQNKGLKVLSFSVRLFIHPDMKLLEQFPGSIGASHWINQTQWVSIMEFWNQTGQTSDYKFRTTLALEKAEGAGNPIYLSLQGDDTYGKNTFNTLWFQKSKMSLPYGKWMTFKVYLKEGDANTGRARIELAIDGGKSKTLFDVKGYTHSRGDTHPDGFTDFTPMKLYAGKAVTDFVRSKGGALQLYWDDLSITDPLGLLSYVHTSTE